MKSESADEREQRLSRYRAHYQKNKSEYARRSKQWRKNNPDKVMAWKSSSKEYHREWNSKKRQGLKGPFSPEDGPNWQARNREHYLQAKRNGTNRRRQEISIECLCHYSNGEPRCYCCGETIIKLLCLDHIDGGGNEHRKREKINKLHVWAKKNGWPPLFRVACHSCNMGAHLNGGVCPHQGNREKTMNQPSLIKAGG